MQNNSPEENTEKSIITNNNNGLWLLEEKLNGSADNSNVGKREFVPSSKKSTKPERTIIESTTFSSSRVEVRKSTTPSTLESITSTRRSSEQADMDDNISKVRIYRIV